MSVRITVIAQAAPSAPVVVQTPTRTEIRDQVRQTIRDVTRGAQDAARDVAAEVNDPVVRAAMADGRTVTIDRGPDGLKITRDNAPAITLRGGISGVEIPPQAVELAIGFFIMCAVMVIGWPIARAFGRRIERRGDVQAVNPMMGEQLQRIEQAVDAISIEVERISESQRFLAKLQNGVAPDRLQLPAKQG